MSKYVGSLVEALRRLHAESIEIHRMSQGDLERYAVGGFLSGLSIGSEDATERLTVAMTHVDPRLPRGHSLGLSWPIPRRDCVAVYAEVECSTPTQATVTACAFLSRVLDRAGITAQEVRVEAIRCSDLSVTEEATDE